MRTSRFEINKVAQTTLFTEPAEFPMKRLMISGFTVVAVLAAATTMLRSHARWTDRPVATADAMSSQASASVKLPTEEFEDMSMVYSAAAKP